MNRYCLYFDEHDIHILSYQKNNTSIVVTTNQVLSFEKNLYQFFLEQGDSETTQKVMLNLIRAFNLTEQNEVSICLKLNGIKSQNIQCDQGITKEELDNICQEEAKLFLSHPSEYILQRENLSQKNPTSFLKYFLFYIPKKYIDRIELPLLPIPKINRFFYLSISGLTQLVPNSPQPAMLFDVQNNYLTVSLIQSRQFRSIQHFPISHNNDAMFFILHILKNQLEKYPLYIAGVSLNDEFLELLQSTNKRSVTKVQCPSNIEIENKNDFEKIYPAIACIAKNS